MLHLRTLGTLDLRRDDGTELLSVVSQPKRIGLLCYLALARPRGFHRRDTVLPLFWPEADDEHARASLRQAVHYLRRSLGEQVVLSRGDEEVGLAPGQLECDVVAFEEALEAGETERALGLYRGELLPGLYVEGAPDFERWLEAERARLRERALKAAWALAEASERAGGASAAAQWARRALELAPTDERMLRACMELLDRVGQASAAGEAYEGYARRLREDEEEPSAELERLAEDIRGRRSSPAPRARPETQPTVHIPSSAPGQAKAGAAVSAVDEPAGTAELAPTASAALPAPPAAQSAPPARSRRWPPPRVAVAGLAAVLLVVVIVGFAVRHWRSARAPAAEITSLAVLPLADVSPGRNQGYFADGLTTELIEVLGQMPGVRVAGPTSSFLFKGKALPLQEIARQLKAAYVIEGSVLRDGAHVRVTIRLTDAATDRQLSNQSYEAANGDLSQIQRDIARYLAGKLGPVASELPLRASTSAEAFSLYLQAVFAAPDEESDARTGSWYREQAIGLYQKALALDPDFGPAWAGLARAHYQAGDFAAAKAEARRALTLDSTLPGAYSALANSLAYGDWNWGEAERVMDRGIRLAPSSVTLYQSRAYLRAALGRADDALRDLDRAEAVDPLSTAVLTNKASFLLQAGRWQEGLRTLERIPGDDPRLARLRFVAYAGSGQRAQAAAIALAHDFPPFTAMVLRADPQEALRWARRPGVADSICTTGHVLHDWLLVARTPPREKTGTARQPTPAQLHEVLTVADEFVYQCTAREVRGHWRWAAFNLRDRDRDSLRMQPRFKALLREVGLPD